MGWPSCDTGGHRREGRSSVKRGKTGTLRHSSQKNNLRDKNSAKEGPVLLIQDLRDEIA